MKDLTHFTLSNGVKIPSVGFGTFQIAEGKPVIDAVSQALELGYRHIDTASIYGNEAGVGQAIRESGLPSSQIFITSKLWNDRQKGEDPLRAFDETLDKLGIEVLDLYLIHWPTIHSANAWTQLNTLYEQGRVRAIGVSNFEVSHLQDLIPPGTMTPLVNQVELHPLFSQTELQKYCSEREMVLEAWSPLMRGKLQDFPLLSELAHQYGKDVGQIVLRWDVQRGIITLPKSVTPSRIRSNLELFDFELSEKDMKRIDSLNRGERLFFSPQRMYEDSMKT